MRSLVPLLILCLAVPGCRNDQSRHVMNNLAHNTGETGDTTSFPLIIDGGMKVVYRFGHLTPDKGLKLYFDTIPNPAGGMLLDDSMRRKLAPGASDRRRD